MYFFEISALIGAFFIIKWTLPEFCRIRSTNKFIFARNQHTVVDFYIELSPVDLHDIL